MPKVQGAKRARSRRAMGQEIGPRCASVCSFPACLGPAWCSWPAKGLYDSIVVAFPEPYSESRRDERPIPWLGYLLEHSPCTCSSPPGGDPDGSRRADEGVTGSTGYRLARRCGSIFLRWPCVDSTTPTAAALRSAASCLRLSSGGRKVQRRLAGDQAADRSSRRHDGAMTAAAEMTADFRQRRPRVLAGQPHRQHPRLADILSLARRTAANRLRRPNTSQTALSMSPSRTARALWRIISARDSSASDRVIGLCEHPRRRFQAVQCARQFAGMGRQMRGDEIRPRRRSASIRVSRPVAAECPIASDNRADRSQHVMPDESRVDKLVAQVAQVGRGAIGGEHQLPPFAQQRVGRVQQFVRRWPVCRRRIAVRR